MSDNNTLLRTVAQEARTLVKNNVENIAIIVKVDSDTRRVASRLSDEYGLNVSEIMSRDTQLSYRGGIVVLSVALAKGIEFEAVFVLGADSETYDPTIEYDVRLLYVAATRALHYLYVFAIGNLSPLLTDASKGAELQFH